MDEFRLVLGRACMQFFDDESMGLERRYGDFCMNFTKAVQQPFSVACIISYLKLKEFNRQYYLH